MKTQSMGKDNASEEPPPAECPDLTENAASLGTLIVIRQQRTPTGRKLSSREMGDWFPVQTR